MGERPLSGKIEYSNMRDLGCALEGVLGRAQLNFVSDIDTGKRSNKYEIVVDSQRAEAWVESQEIDSLGNPNTGYKVNRVCYSVVRRDEKLRSYATEVVYTFITARYARHITTQDIVHLIKYKKEAVLQGDKRVGEELIRGSLGVARLSNGETALLHLPTVMEDGALDAADIVELGDLVEQLAEKIPDPDAKPPLRIVR